MSSPLEVSEAYAFCPKCGTKREVSGKSRPFRCHECGHTCFFGPVAAVGGIVRDKQGLVLLLERARDPGRGKLGMPGGFVDPYESAEHALHREVKEEVGISIENVQFLMTYPNRYIYQDILNPVLDVFFVADACEAHAIAPEEAEVTGWIWSDLKPDTLASMAFESNRLALEVYLRNQRNG
ncbi:MAG: NUDIX domain-containing protein [Planctomycetes bacterium]|nr:NUDIX domain-containing protein [Planctomycetota bacterium]